MRHNSTLGKTMRALAATWTLLALIACGEGEVCALSLVAFGDQGTGTCAQLRVAQAVESFCAAEGCDAGLLLGDNFYPSGVTSVNDSQWKSKFVAMYGGLGFPFYATLGNHDDGDDLSRARYQVEYSAFDPRWIMPNEYYTVELGPALLMALDTKLLLHGLSADEQAAEFAQAMQVSGAPWRIAFGHHPYQADGSNDVSRQRVNEFYANHLCGAADLFLAGHRHHLEVLDGPSSCPGVFVVSGGGGAKLRPIRGPDDELRRFAAEAHGFAHLEITDSQIRLRMVEVRGDVLFDEIVLP